MIQRDRKEQSQQVRYKHTMDKQKILRKEQRKNIFKALWNIKKKKQKKHEKRKTWKKITYTKKRHFGWVFLDFSHIQANYFLYKFE